MSTADYYIKKNNTNNFGQNNDNKKRGLWFEKKITNGEFLPKQTNSTIVFVNKQLKSLDNILYIEKKKNLKEVRFLLISVPLSLLFLSPAIIKKNNFIQYLLVVYNTQTFDRTSPKLLYLLYTPYYPPNQKSSKKKKEIQLFHNVKRFSPKP